MARRRLVFVLLIVAFIATEPVVHTHPLVSSSINGCVTPNICAACSVRAERVATPAPAPAPPETVLYSLLAATVPVVTADVCLEFASRAPPAAA